MKVLITGCGRSGTNWLTEIIRASDQFNVTKSIEDRKFFDHIELPDRYATKLATENTGFTWENINKKMLDNLDLMIIFSIRNPISLCMAKIVRGQSSLHGGDGSVNMAPDATVAGSVGAVQHMYDIYARLYSAYPDRVTYIKLENLIKNPAHEVNFICKFLDIDIRVSMLSAHKNNRNSYQKKRYGNKIDKSQADISEKWDEAYNGYFKDRGQDIKTIGSGLSYVMFGFEYGEII